MVYTQDVETQSNLRIYEILGGQKSVCQLTRIMILQTLYIDVAGQNVESVNHIVPFVL